MPLKQLFKVEFADFFKKHRLLLIFSLVVILLRIPSLFEPYWYGDEGVYLTLGLGIRRGLLLYKEIFDNKTPVIYLLSALVDGHMFGLRLIFLFTNLAGLYYFYQLVNYFLSKTDSKIRLLLILVFIYLTNTRNIEGNIANAENFYLVTSLAGFYYALVKEKYLISGLIFSLGFLTKVPALFDFGALVVYLILFAQKTKRLITLSRREIILIIGFIAPILLSFIFFTFRGAFKEYLTSAYIQTVGYLSSWDSGSHQTNLLTLITGTLGIKLMIAALITGLLFLQRNNLDKKIILLTLWAVYSLFAATLSGRPYPHYLLQVVAPYILLIGFWSKVDWKKWLLPGVSFVLIAISLFYYRFGSYPNLSYYQNFLRFSSGQINQEKYFDYFDRDLYQTYQAAQTINNYSGPNDRIFVWGDRPYLYALSRRIPATPYVVAYHIKDLRLESRNLLLLLNDPPALFVVDKKMDMPESLKSFVGQRYRLAESTSVYNIFALRDYIAQIF